MDEFYNEPDRRAEAGPPGWTQDPARCHELRTQAIAVADMLTQLGLAHLEIGGRAGRPLLAYRAGGHLVRAAAWYAAGGLGRRSQAIARLIERCRLAWLRFEAAEGFA